MAAFQSALYQGRVAHCRLRPRRHQLTYRVFWLLLDLTEIDLIAARCRLFSRNRFNLASFHDRDYGDGSGDDLLGQVDRHLATAGIARDGGPVRLLTMPRLLGYVFNPLSIYFCYRGGGGLAAIIYEVSNTFGKRHSYVVPVTEQAGAIRQECPKRFFVSPFLGMSLDYVFRVLPPAERVTVSISGRDTEGPVIGATLSAGRLDLDDASLLRSAILFPFNTLKVIAGIHWEALLMWLKGFRLFSPPETPDHGATVAHQIPKRQGLRYGGH